MKKDELILWSVFVGISATFAIIAVSVESIVAKWILGIIAVAIFLFTIYGIVDGVVKSRRKPKDFSELFKEYIEKESKKPDFHEKMTGKANRRDILFDGQRPSSNDYGYSMNNPIMTSSVTYSDEYLLSLRTSDGQKFTWKRMGSYCVREISGIKNVMVDHYQLYLSGNPYKEIYICPYGHNSTYVPQELKLSDSDSDIEKEAKEKGLSTDEILTLRKMEEDNARLKQKMKESENKKIEELSRAVKSTYPNFDFNLENKNPLFAKLMRAHIDMKAAYEVLHKNQLLTRINTTYEQKDNTFYTSEQYYKILCDQDAILIEAEKNRNQSTEELEKEAVDKGVTVEQLKMFREMVENESVENRKKVYLSQSKIAERLKCEYPNFDLIVELKNPKFKNLITMDIDMQIAYELIHLDELFNRK